MHSPTLSSDFSSRMTLAFAPFQPPLAPCARCFPSKPRVLTLLRTLFLSWRSFRRSPRLFSIACGLFLQNTGGWGTSATSPRSLRLSVLQAGLSAIIRLFLSPLCFHPLTNPSSSRIDLQHLCFHALTNPFFRNLFVFTSIQNTGGWDPNYG